jgi:threonine dehydrogenase-like Zn-dependent dehydrogenase
MADIVVDAAGAPSAVEQSFDIVRSGGTIAFVGLRRRKLRSIRPKLSMKCQELLAA